MDLLPETILDRIALILEEAPPEEVLAPHRDGLTPQEWTFVCDYARREVRSTLEIGWMLRSVLAVAEQRGAASPAVCRWLRGHQGVRTRNFGVADADDERFMQIALEEGRGGLVAELERARQRAEEKLFEDTELPVTNPPPLGKRETLEVL